MSGISRSDRAERMATSVIQTYCADLQPTDAEDLACLLTKLISTTAQAVVKYCGKEVALQMLERTGAHINSGGRNG